MLEWEADALDPVLLYECTMHHAAQSVMSHPQQLPVASLDCQCHGGMRPDPVTMMSADGRAGGWQGWQRLQSPSQDSSPFPPIHGQPDLANPPPQGARPPPLATLTS